MKTVALLLTMTLIQALAGEAFATEAAKPVKETKISIRLEDIRQSIREDLNLREMKDCRIQQNPEMRFKFRQMLQTELTVAHKSPADTTTCINSIMEATANSCKGLLQLLTDLEEAVSDKSVEEIRKDLADEVTDEEIGYGIRNKILWAIRLNEADTMTAFKNTKLNTCTVELQEKYGTKLPTEISNAFDTGRRLMEAAKINIKPRTASQPSATGTP